MAPRLTVAQKKAAAALEAASQPGLKVSTEILNMILTNYVEERPDDKSAWKLFKQMLIPMLYKRVCLTTTEAYILFMKRPDLESYKYITAVDMSGVSLATPTNQGKEEASMKALRKRAVAYKKALGAKLGEEEASLLWPQEVAFSVGEGNYDLPETSYICRLMRLFAARTITVNHYGSLVLAYHTGEILPDQTPWHVPTLQLHDTVRLAPEVTTMAMMIPVFGHIEMEVRPQLRLLGGQLWRSDVGNYELRYAIHELEGRVWDMCRAASYAQAVVQIQVKNGRHVFCSRTGALSTSPRSSKIRLTCCEGPCTEPKNQVEKLLDDFLRYDEAIAAMSARLISEIDPGGW